MPDSRLCEQLVELIRRASSDLPEDVQAALTRGCAAEAPGSLAGRALALMIENVIQARRRSLPLCQDTGTLLFYVDHGPELRTPELRQAFREATAQATAKNYLRPNTVEVLSGKNTGNNLGEGAPHLHFTAREEPGLRVRLLLKGGGSENCGMQYSLPDAALGAGRNLAGVEKCVLDAINRAQGHGCAPGTLGVGVGGDRLTGFQTAKEQHFRPLHDANPNPVLARLEQTLYEKGNRLPIGPMGFGGKTTLLGVKIGAHSRLPASYFVSVSYLCWAFRRRTLYLDGAGARIE